MTRLGAALDSYDQPYYGRDAQLVPIQSSPRETRPTFPVELTVDELRAMHASVGPLELLLDGAAATTPLEVDFLAMLAAVLLDHAGWFTGFEDAAGDHVACLHSQFVGWRRRPGGLATTETVLAARLVKARQAIPIPG